MIEKILILKSEIKEDNKRIKRTLEKFEKAYESFCSSTDHAHLVEAGFYVNQLYSGCENIFKHIAKTFENNIEQDLWHKSLLDRMKLDIDDIRPAFLSEETYLCLNELRIFRHFFRNAYDVDLQENKFSIVAQQALNLKCLLDKDINKFLFFLKKLQAEE